MRGVSRIPHGEDVKSSRENTSLEQSKQDTGDDEMLIFFDESLTEGDQAKQEDAKREEYARGNSFENEIRWDLHFYPLASRINGGCEPCNDYAIESKDQCRKPVGRNIPQPKYKG